MVAQLFNTELYFFAPRAISVLIVGAAIFCLGLFTVVRERWSSVGMRYLLFTVTAALWLMSFGMAYASRQETIALRWFHLGEIGICFIPAAIASANLSIIQKERQFRWFLRSCFVSSALFCGFLLCTDNYLNGLYRYSWGWYPRFDLIGMLYIVYFVAVGAFSRLLIYRAFQRSDHPLTRLRLKGLMIAAGIGYLGALDFVPCVGYPLYPVGYVPIAAYFFINGWVIGRYRLMDITPETAAGQILETMYGAVIVVDREGRIQVINRAALEMLGYHKAELLGKDLSFILPNAAEMSANVLTGPSSCRRETVWSGRNGQQYDVELAASPLAGHGAVPAGTVYIAHDITERKKAEARLKSYSEDLAEVNEELKNFTAIVSHDLRAPLVSIKGFAGEFAFVAKNINSLVGKHLDQFEKDERQALAALLGKDIPEALEYIGSSVSRMDNLISAIMKLSRAGRRKLNPEPVKMQEFIQGILKTLAHQIESRNITVTIMDLPDLVADRTAVEQIFGNLLDNAVKYREHGRPGMIEVSAECKGHEVVFSVRDNGRGMAQVDIPKAFEIFRRVGKQDMPGEGMGLAYVKTLVRSMGGRIWCESEPGRGATFLFTIPNEVQIGSTLAHHEVSL